TVVGGLAGNRHVQRPLAERWDAIVMFMASEVRQRSPLRLSPSTRDFRKATEWLRSLGAGLDGIIAKRADLPYQSGNRHGMQKYKLERTADCVVGGFRYSSKGGTVGSLLLGLYDDAALLHH